METQDFLLNPEVLEEKYKGNWAQPQSFGLSHRRMHFTGNENAVIPLTVYFDQLILNERGTNDFAQALGGDEALLTSDEWRLFLISLTYPRRGQTILSASPPRVLFVWPAIIDMEVRVTDLNIRHILFDTRTTGTRAFVATMNLVEDRRDKRIFSQDVRRRGTKKPFRQERPRSLFG